MKDREHEIEIVKAKHDIIGDDPQLNLALYKALQVADSKLTIFITGESGVGKDVFSKIIHENSSRKSKKLIAVNCGALPEGTIESELFGHRKGAFTGADRDRKGYFEEANGGTIFLDEVGELPLNMQVKLLRVLENQEILPMGENVPRKVDVRIVAATNVDIMEAIKHGKFREDLYYRLNQISIYIPPLRERKEDIPLLFSKFASDIVSKYSGNIKPVRLTDDGKEYIKSYPWRGNIRELKNITEQISYLEETREISKAILQSYLNFEPQDLMPTIYQGNNASNEQVTMNPFELQSTILKMRGEINELRQAVSNMANIVHSNNMIEHDYQHDERMLSHNHYTADDNDTNTIRIAPNPMKNKYEDEEVQYANVVDEEEKNTTSTPLTLAEIERNAITAALERNRGNR
ncbi:MAG: sigma-54-dependent Fis family transcriptional regulator, partial [Bacteroidales bacterium]|nr:sigma-54-dependent Fis family transcriptional regulator [Bacteroidales bacterium]